MVKLVLVSEYFPLFGSFKTQVGLSICKPNQTVWYLRILKGLWEQAE